MPPDMAISMRHSKITAKEAALLAGELNKPSWESRNEGIHERVSFEDTIWGFDLAGGLFYKTPLRVTYVKPDSRAEKAGIRPGDRLKRINDIDTSTLTIQEAHDIIVESGVHIKLAVTAPEDEEDSYNCYEDPIDTGYDSEEERRKEEEKARKRQVHARVSHFWSLQWPWVSKRRVIYRESNCFLVPSKFEEKHRDKFPIQPTVRVEDDIVLHSSNLEKENLHLRGGDLNNTNPNEPLMNENGTAIYQEQFSSKQKQNTSLSSNGDFEVSEESKNNSLSQSGIISDDLNKLEENKAVPTVKDSKTDSKALNNDNEGTELNSEPLSNGAKENKERKIAALTFNADIDSKDDTKFSTANGIKPLNRSLSEVLEIEEKLNSLDEQQNINESFNNIQNNGEVNGDVSAETENNELIDEILNDSNNISTYEEDNIINDIVNNEVEVEDENVVSEVAQDSSELLDER